MKIDIQNNIIQKLDESGNRKEHKAISTSFSQIETLKDGRIPAPRSVLLKNERS